MPENKSFVHIIGAGPSGGIAALSALRNGYEVVVSEEHREIGVPTHCSGLFSKTGLESLREFFDYKKLAINPIRGAIFDFAGERFEIMRKEPVAYVCDRAAVDREITNNAITEGAKIEYGKKINDISNLESNIIIGADGPFSTVARMFDFPKIERYASTVQGFFKYRCEHDDCVQVYLSNEKFPGFFGWVIPHSEELAEIGVGVTLPNNVSRAWEHMLKITGVDRSEYKPRGAAIPIRMRKQTAMHKERYKVCLVGDAAGQTKATTGGGVMVGGNCAKYAGMHCENPLRYEFEWRLRFGTDLLIHKNIQVYLESKTDLEIAGLGKSLKKFGMHDYLSMHGHMDRPTKMIGPQIIPYMLGIS